MTAAFECEVRFAVPDIDALHRRLASLGGRVILDYAFTDHYFQPAGRMWNPRERALRIREHMSPEAESELVLTRVEIVSAEGLSFKRSHFPEGKVRLYAGPLADCRRVVESLGFEPWVTVRKRDGKLFELPGVGELVTEHIDGVGWMCEVEQEGSDPRVAAGAIRRTLDVLGVDPANVTAEPVAAIVSSNVTRPKKVYFCGAIRGGRALQPLYRSIVDFLQSRGFEVLTTHVADPDVVNRETRAGLTAEGIYDRDLRWLGECDLVIAEVSLPSLGVGIEIAEAQHMQKPIIALTRDDVHLSALIAGNLALKMLTYANEADLFKKLAVEIDDRWPGRLRIDAMTRRS